MMRSCHSNLQISLSVSFCELQLQPPSLITAVQKAQCSPLILQLRPSCCQTLTFAECSFIRLFLDSKNRGKTSCAFHFLCVFFPEECFIISVTDIKQHCHLIDFSFRCFSECRCIKGQREPSVYGCKSKKCGNQMTGAIYPKPTVCVFHLPVCTYTYTHPPTLEQKQPGLHYDV